MNPLIILGNGIAGNLAALYLRKRLPELPITLVGKSGRRRPIVGESTVEVTCHFLEGLGLGSLLEERHFHKYGLTYYFKRDLGDPASRQYVVHEAQGVLRMPSYNLNRITFDADLRAYNEALGVYFLDADAVSFLPRGTPEGLHQIVTSPVEGRRASLDARWVIDATGRNRFLAQQLGLKRPSPWQRSCFWFRLRDFDRARLTDLEAIKPAHHCYDPYYVTHHFYGRGYWIWLIPIRSETGGEDLISVGFTYRPDLLDGDVLSLTAFLEHVERDHPVVTAFVRSGQVVDTNVYRNYMYEASRYFSEDGWFLLGDAGFSLDPINSAGLSVIAHQIPQIAAIVQKDLSGTLTREYVGCLDHHVKAQLSLQDTWSRWYEFMHEPLKMAWTLLMANIAYFHFVLPNYINGAFLDGREAQTFANRLPRYVREEQPPAYPFPPLLDALTESHPRPSPDLLPNLYGRCVNWRLFRADAGMRARSAARYFLLLAFLRWTLLRSGWRRPTRATARLWLRNGASAMGEVLRALALRLAPSSFVRGGDTPAHLRSPFTPGGGFLEFSRRWPAPPRRLGSVDRQEVAS